MLNIDTLMKYVPQLFFLLVITNMVDAATTAQLVEWGGLEVEVNPVMRYIIEHYGTFGMVAYKCLAILFLWFVYDFVRKFKPATHLWVMVLCLPAVCIVYTCLALHNVWAVYYVSSFQS
jgi:hypothetical protein